MNARLARGWLWKADALLAAGVAIVACAELSGSAPLSVPRLDAALPKKGPLVPSGPSFSCEDMLRFVRRFHGAPPPPRPAPVPAAPEGPLPLAALRPVLLYRANGEPEAVTLKSKDPARLETYFLMTGQPSKGIT